MAELSSIGFGETPSPASGSSLGAARLGVVGTGAMAEAMVAGLLGRTLIAPAQVTCSHPRRPRREELEVRWGVHVTESNVAAVAGADVVILAVKPQVLSHLMPELAGGIAPGALVVSIVAGASTVVLSRGLRHPAIVRAMPNTPAQIGSGMTVWYGTAEVDERGVAATRQLLSALGQEFRVEDESLVAMATAVSGTGPTYTFLFLEAMIDAAVHLGFPRHVARSLVVGTVLGAAEFAAKSDRHVAELRDMVTSPGGTSAAALAQLERGRFRTVLGDAVWAAYNRTLELEARLDDASRGSENA